MSTEYIKGLPREQLSLFNDCLDDIIPMDSPVRVIDLFVDSQENKIEFEQSESRLGRPKYSPFLFLKIYMYCYLKKINSSRLIEEECKKNIDLIWLTQGLRPDHWSINNFRKKHSTVLGTLLSKFLVFCSEELKLIDLDTVAVDGTKIKAQNSRMNVATRENIENRIARTEERIKEYMEELDSSDNNKSEEKLMFQKRIKNLERVKEKLKAAEEQFNEKEDLDKIFMTDCDSRFQKDNGRVNPGYNSQIIVDDKHYLIVDACVTNENNDLHQLEPMTQRLLKLKELLGKEGKTLLIADAGYSREASLNKVMDLDEIDVYVADPKKVDRKEKQNRSNKNMIPAKGFEKDDFIYNEDNNTFTCPEGHELYQNSKGSIARGSMRVKYYCKKCHGCSKRSLCTKNKKGRVLDVSIDYKKTLEFKKKMQTPLARKMMQKRKEIVEHPFGTLKGNWAYRQFLRRGLGAVDDEFRFMCFVYDFKRVLKIVGFEKLIKKLKSA